MSNPNRPKKNEVLSPGVDDSKNLSCKSLHIGDYEYVNISSSAVLGIKLWLEEDGDLNRDDLFSNDLKIQSTDF